MDKKITLSAGILAALCIQLLKTLFVGGAITQAMSMGLSILALFIAIAIAIFLTSKYYVATMVELLTQGVKTAATVVVFLFLFTLIIHFFIQKNSDLPRTTMGILFMFGLSGFLSSFVSAFIIHNFTKK